MLTLTAIVLSISIVGIPLLILLPFAVLVLLLMALVGFSGTVSAIGQWARRRFGMGTSSGLVDVCLGILVVVLPLLVARFVAFGGWTLSPIVFLLVATGLAVEFLAWSSGFGAVLTNVFSRWQAKRSALGVAHRPPREERASSSCGDTVLTRAEPVERGGGRSSCRAAARHKAARSGLKPPRIQPQEAP